MKRLIVFFLILSCRALFPQDLNNSRPFSTFRFAALGGMTYTSLPGGSLVIEGKTNLTRDLNVKLSIGYSSLNKNDSYKVKTYAYIGKFNDEIIDEYWSVSYNVDKIIYNVFPASLGFEYTFIHDRFSPYAHFEIGYNYFTYNVEESQGATGALSAKTLQGLPAEYRNDPPQISEDKTTAARIAFGIGTNYKLTQNVNLDIRYVYQINKLVINSNQLLIGLNF